jgi:hypothetical protein
MTLRPMASAAVSPVAQVNRSLSSMTAPTRTEVPASALAAAMECLRLVRYVVYACRSACSPLVDVGSA